MYIRVTMRGHAKGKVIGTSDRQTARGASELTEAPWRLNHSAHMIERLESLRETPVDERWMNAVWPSDEAFDAALSFIQSLPADMLCIPDIGLADDGEINFLWKNESVHVDLGFHDAKSFSISFAPRTERSFWTMVCPRIEAFHPRLLRCSGPNRSCSLVGSGASERTVKRCTRAVSRHCGRRRVATPGDVQPGTCQGREGHRTGSLGGRSPDSRILGPPNEARQPGDDQGSDRNSPCEASIRKQVVRRGRSQAGSRCSSAASLGRSAGVCCHRHRLGGQPRPREHILSRFLHRTRLRTETSDASFVAGAHVGG